MTETERNFQTAIRHLRDAEKGFVNGRYVGEKHYNLPYEKHNTLITGLRSIIDMINQSDPDIYPDILLDEVIERAKFILSEVGA